MSETPTDHKEPEKVPELKPPEPEAKSVSIIEAEDTSRCYNKLLKKIKKHKNNLLVLVNIAALLITLPTAIVTFQNVNDTQEILRLLHGENIFERAQLVKDYLDFTQKFSITIHSFNPEQSNYKIPLDLINLANYRTEGIVWITVGEFCIDQNPVKIEQRNNYGQGFDLQPNQPRTMEIQLPDDFISKLNEINSFIVKTSVVSYPYDPNVGAIDELEKQKFMWVKFDHDVNSSQLHPNHVSDEKINCNDLPNFNEDITISSDDKWVYLVQVSRMAKT